MAGLLLLLITALSVCEFFSSWSAIAADAELISVNMNFCRMLGGWYRWALLSADGVVPSRMVGVYASVNLPLHPEKGP